MECDVIPTSPQELNPLGNVEHRNGLDEDGVLFSQTFNATLITSADNVNSVSKSRKIINLSPTKGNRRLLTVRSSALPPVVHTTNNLIDSNHVSRNLTFGILFLRKPD